jgi:hypothetical protein
MKYKIRRDGKGLHVTAAATDKIGFYGVTPVAQPSGATQAAATDAASTQALANALRTALVNLGLIKGSAILIFLIGIVALLASLPVQAYVDTATVPMTNNVAALATVTDTNALGGASAILDVSNHEYVSVFLSFKGIDATNAGPVTLTFARSPTGLAFETTPVISVATTANGQSTVLFATNIVKEVLGGASHIQLTSFVNGATNRLTNIVLQLNRKHIY